MKNLIGLIALLLLNLAAFGNTENNVTPELKVLSKSGLKLRLSPDIKAPVLDVIEYGETLQLEEDYTDGHDFTVSWTRGKWIKVQYESQIGYVFDGFASILPVPYDALEFTPTVSGLSATVYNWAFNNYDLISTDTLTDNEMAFTSVSQLGMNELFVHETEQITRVDFTFKNIRIMDAYHLLESMMENRQSRSMLKENSMFFAGIDGDLNKIKIGNGMVLIRKLDNGDIKVSCKTIHEGC